MANPFESLLDSGEQKEMAAAEEAKKKRDSVVSAFKKHENIIRNTLESLRELKYKDYSVKVRSPEKGYSDNLGCDIGRIERVMDEGESRAENRWRSQIRVDFALDSNNNPRLTCTRYSYGTKVAASLTCPADLDALTNTLKEIHKD